MEHVLEKVDQAEESLEKGKAKAKHGTRLAIGAMEGTRLGSSVRM